MKKIFAALGAGLLVFISGCNLRVITATQSPDAAYTQAALTVEAELTQVGAQPSQTPLPLIATPTSVSTITLTPLAINTTGPCNQAVFITDVTIPDGTVISPGQPFTKTWRLQNTGSCTWDSTYRLVFENGDPLGVPAGYAQALTSGQVSPGQTLDITVNLTAPLASRSYKGYWGIREPNAGRIFTSFTVVIQVPNPTPHTVTLSNNPLESGHVQSDGVFNTVTTMGDLDSNVSAEVFLSFDISNIPSNATITQVMMDLTNYVLQGNPFVNLGCIKSFAQTYSALSASSYVPGPAPSNEDHDWCSIGDLNVVTLDNDFRYALQAKIGTSNRLEYRLQFATSTNNDGIADTVRFGVVRLIVTYTTP